MPDQLIYEYGLMFHDKILSELALLDDMDKLQKSLEKTKRENHSNRPSKINR